MHPNHTQEQIAEIKKWLGSGSINIFGRPFAGKDTQGKLLADLFDGSLIGGGDILRGSSQVSSYLTQAIDAGFLAPTDEYINTVLPYFSKPEFDGQALILSSVGRWEGEEKSVVKAAEQSGHPLKAVIYLNISETTVKHRWQKSQDGKSRGDRGFRADDGHEKLAVRLREFTDKTLPVIEHYRQAGLLYEIAGNDRRPAVEITAAILDHLLKLAQS